ncbi:MAG: hypothetical protein WED82_02055 [Balneolales bacterium]
MKTEKTNNSRVKVTLSVHEVINYTQEVWLTPEEVETLNEIDDAPSDSDGAEIIRNSIDFTNIYHRDGSYMDIEIMDEV